MNKQRDEWILKWKQKLIYAVLICSLNLFELLSMKLYYTCTQLKQNLFCRSIILSGKNYRVMLEGKLGVLVRVYFNKYVK